MRDVTLTLYRNAQSTEGEPVTRSWADWLPIFSRHEVRGEPSDEHDKVALDKAKNGAAFIAGEVPVGMLRKGPNVRAIHALLIDIDSVPEPMIEAALATIRPFEFAAWTTHKSGAAAVGGGLRLRVVLPLRDPLGPTQFPGAWAGLQALIGGVNDVKTKDIGRLHYMPSTFDAKRAVAFSNAGRWIYLDDLPDVVMAGALKGDARAKVVDKVRRAVITNNPTGDARVKALHDGVAFAESGHRHEAIVALTWAVALRDSELRQSELDALFGPSLAAMRAADPSCPGMEDVYTAYQGAVQKMADDDVETEREKRTRAREKAQREQVHEAEEGTGQGPYTDVDMTRIAAVHGWEASELKQRWLLQQKGAAWVLDEQGRYRGPYAPADLAIASRRLLVRSPVPLVTVTKSGYSYRPVADVVSDHGTIIEKIVSDLTAQQTTFDWRTGQLKEAVRPLRALEPVFDPQIDGWLRTLAGPFYDRLIDWLSCVPDLNKLLCAIYLDGVNGAGKTLLAVGLARLWTEGPPADIRLVLSDFNDELARCPMVLADEEIPRKYQESVTATLRSMLSTMSRTLKRKYAPPSELYGAMRLVIAANNEFLLDSKEVTSQQDLEAIARRFLYIHVSRAATDLLESLPRSTRDHWANLGIAQHTMWLHKNHIIAHPGKRFWVEGDVSAMHRLLITGTKWNSLVCEALVRYCLQPTLYDKLGSGLIRRGSGRLLVNDQAVIDMWDTYLKTKADPETSRVGHALRALSKAGRPRMRHKGDRIRYNDVDIAHLASWAERHNIGDQARIVASLNEGSLSDVDTEGDADDSLVEDLDSLPTANGGNEPF